MTPAKSKSYLVSIAGDNTTITLEDGTKSTGPSTVDITYIPEMCWPVLHAAFASDDLSQRFWYVPATEVIPVVEDAIRAFKERKDELKPLIHPLDWRRLEGNRRVLERMLDALRRHSDNIVAWGVVEHELPA